MKYQALRLLLWRWHRRLGLAAALFLVWLAISGVLLNHTSSLGLASKLLPKSLASSVYSLEPSKAYSLDSRLGQFRQFEQYLFLDGQRLERCEGELLGLLESKGHNWLACSEQVLLFDAGGNLVEVLDQYFGLPTPILRIARCEDSLCIESQSKIFRFDDSSGNWQPHSAEINWLPVLQPQTKELALVPEVHNWERFILEAHSGRLFGKWGVLVVDLAGLATILLALSGCYVWWSHNRRRKLALRRSQVVKRS